MHPRGSAAPYSDHASAVSAAPFPDATTAQSRRKTHEPAPYTWRQDASPLSPDEQLRLLLADFEMSSLSKLTSAGSSSRFKVCTVAAFRRQALKGTPVATAPLHR